MARWTWGGGGGGGGGFIKKGEREGLYQKRIIHGQPPQSPHIVHLLGLELAARRNLVLAAALLAHVAAGRRWEGRGRRGGWISCVSS